MSSFDERMEGEPDVRPATLAELLEAYGPEGVERMYAAGELTVQQAAAYRREHPKAPRLTAD